LTELLLEPVVVMVGAEDEDADVEMAESAGDEYWLPC